jgi:hypothetical protein
VQCDIGPGIGDERGSVGTGTDERIRQDRPTSTGFCIGDDWALMLTRDVNHTEDRFRQALTRPRRRLLR